MRRGTVLTAVVATVIAAGCSNWAQSDFDAGASRANTSETTLTTANAPSLTDHTMPGTVVAVVGSTIVTEQGADVVAFDAATCPRTDHGPCSPRWSRANRAWGAGDATHLVLTAGSTFEVTDGAGNVLWTGIPEGVSGFAGTVERVAIAGDRIVLADDTYLGHGSTDEKINVFPLAGCGVATCAPTRTFPNLDRDAWRVGGGTLLHMPTPSAITAVDLGSGAVRWAAAGNFVWSLVRIRGGQVFAYRSGTDPVTEVYDLAGVQGCTGVPRTCAPIRTLSTPGPLNYGSAYTDGSGALAMGSDNGDGTASRALALFATGTCASPCAPSATTQPGTTWSDQGFLAPAYTANLVIAVAVPPGFVTRTFHLRAYDARLAAGCTGDPKVCAPVADIAFSGEGSAAAGAPIAAGGRVYVTIPVAAPITHVFSLPGDVG